MTRLCMILAAMMAFAGAASAEGKPMAKRADPCTPIGKTADGKLVYSLSCDSIPVAAVAPTAQTQALAPAAPVEEEDPGGLFRNPFPSLIRPTNAQRTPGVGPAAAGP